VRRAVIAIDFDVRDAEAAARVAADMRSIDYPPGFNVEVTVLDTGFPPATAGGQAQEGADHHA